MYSKMPLIAENHQPSSQWKQCCYNYFLLFIVPISLLAIFVTPIQLFARYLQGDIFALFVLVYSIGIGWNQLYSLIQSYNNLMKSSNNDSAIQLFASITYKLISLGLAIASSNFALEMIHNICPLNAPFKPIRSCFSPECSYLYITSTACYYWFAAMPIIELSMKIFTKIAIHIEIDNDTPQKVLTI